MSNLQSLSHSELARIAQAMMAPGKGILAADESAPTCGRRFKALGIPTTEEKRREYRDILFTTPDLADYISGVILFDETLHQSTLEGEVPFAEYLMQRGIIPGIKVDTGAKALAGYTDETITEGLDGLRERLEEYHSLGARFAKWRGVYKITDTLPSAYATQANAHALARYAALCQEAGIVPIVEPEILMDGSHDIERCYDVTINVQKAVFDELRAHKVQLDGMILKPNMVISGKDAANRADAETVARETIRCLKETVPSEVPGIAFLSGGQSDQEAAEHLCLMKKHHQDLPWQVTFSYGRALHQAAMNAWHGDSANRSAAQQAMSHRAKMNSLASAGGYSEACEMSKAA